MKEYQQKHLFLKQKLPPRKYPVNSNNSMWQKELETQKLQRNQWRHIQKMVVCWVLEPGNSNPKVTGAVKENSLVHATLNQRDDPFVWMRTLKY